MSFEYNEISLFDVVINFVVCVLQMNYNNLYTYLPHLRHNLGLVALITIRLKGNDKFVAGNVYFN